METDMKVMNNTGGCDGGVEGGGAFNHSRGGGGGGGGGVGAGFGRPSWLLFSIADLDEKMKMVAANMSEECGDDSFAKRAEDYYQKRPQLLALLQDSYNGYLLLADRYCQALAKNNHRRRYSSPISPFNFNENDRSSEEDSVDVIDSDDASSSLSFQTACPPAMLSADVIVAELVIKSVDFNLIVHELSMTEKNVGDSSRKIDLQKSLLEVLESERMILLNENASLAFRVNALLEENQGLVTESLFMKRKAADLARFVLQVRDDHKVCMLSRKIEELQGKIYELEQTNKEYYDQLVEHGKKKIKAKGPRGKSSTEMTLEDCYHTRQGILCIGCGGKDVLSAKKGSFASKFWARFKKLDIFMCGS